MSVVAEGAHAKGQEGAALAKRYLESTTFIRLPFSVYDDPAQTTLVRLDGAKKRYDLAGNFMADKPHPLSVEVKNYDVVGDQAAEYTAYLANAYSITAHEIAEKGADPRRHFIWITWHPFSQTKWPKLTSRDEIRDAVDTHPQVLGGNAFDEDLAMTVAERLWLLVLSSKQEQLMLTSAELLKVHQVLDRKGF